LKVFAGFRAPLRKRSKKMAGIRLNSYYSNSALQTQLFSQDQPVNTDWFDKLQEQEHTQNNISVSGSTE
jgi:hypothetical protein